MGIWIFWDMDLVPCKEVIPYSSIGGSTGLSSLESPFGGNEFLGIWTLFLVERLSLFGVSFIGGSTVITTNQLLLVTSVSCLWFSRVQAEWRSQVAEHRESALAGGDLCFPCARLQGGGCGCHLLHLPLLHRLGGAAGIPGERAQRLEYTFVPSSSWFRTSLIEHVQPSHFRKDSPTFWCSLSHFLMAKSHFCDLQIWWFFYLLWAILPHIWGILQDVPLSWILSHFLVLIGWHLWCSPVRFSINQSLVQSLHQTVQQQLIPHYVIQNPTHFCWQHFAKADCGFLNTESACLIFFVLYWM